jgi:hypothetical protein
MQLITKIAQVILVAACPALAVGCGVLGELPWTNQPGYVNDHGLSERLSRVEDDLTKMRTELMLMAGAGSLAAQGGASLLELAVKRKKQATS